MSRTETTAHQRSGNNASEFIRKLFCMLGDLSHQDVVRWGKDGDTFVVVESEKFTRSVLPKLFKHSNMSSFIRQLNKYDFHKMLEFKHPYFRADSKDGIDNIRRKAPAARNPPAAEDFTNSQLVSVISGQIAATQQQVQQFQELYAEVSQTNRLLVSKTLALEKMLNAQKQAQFETLNYLSSYNDGRNRGVTNQSSNFIGPSEADDSVFELRRARELLSAVTTDSVTGRELERLHDTYGITLADSATMITPVSMLMPRYPTNDLSRYPAYPVGQTVGIDPFHSDYIHKIPYAMPDEGASLGISEAPASALATATPAPFILMDKSTSSELWGAKKPVVFLVEDDPTCAKIGMKFLESMGCEAEHANGADAYNRISNIGRDHFDMVFMNIMMPPLDGVSTTMYIRQHCPSAPIIAMTSNIRPDEVNGYFERGMNGVLAKPFTEEGMLRQVIIHVPHLLKNPATQQEGDRSGYTMGNALFLDNALNIGQNSASQCYGLMNGGNQYGVGRPDFGMTIDTTFEPTSEHGSPPEKRQRVNSPQGNCHTTRCTRDMDD